MMHEPVLREIGDLEIAVFQWSREYGECWDCGLPAAYAAGSPPERDSIPERRLCCVCAAEAAAGGETIDRLDERMEQT